MTRQSRLIFITPLRRVDASHASAFRERYWPNDAVRDADFAPRITVDAASP